MKGEDKSLIVEFAFSAIFKKDKSTTLNSISIYRIVKAIG